MFRHSKPQTGGPNPAMASKMHWRKAVLPILLVIILVGGGGYLYQHHQNQQKAKKAAQPYAYTYGQLTTYKLAGLNPGGGMKFNVPKEFNAPTASAAKASQVQLSQGPVKNGRPATIAGISAASIYTGVAPTSDYLKTLSASIVDPKNSNYKSVTDPLQTYVTQRISVGYSVSFGAPVAFTNSYIKANAWSLGFTATAKSASSLAIDPPMTGQTLLIVGKNAFYYYTVDAVSYNWTSNQKFWQGILGSLQVDQ